MNRVRRFVIIVLGASILFLAMLACDTSPIVGDAVQDAQGTLTCSVGHLDYTDDGHPVCRK